MPLDLDFLIPLFLCLSLLPGSTFAQCRPGRRVAREGERPAAEQELPDEKPLDEKSPEQEALRLDETVEVTATRIPEPVADVPGALEVFSAEELAARGATDLRSALALAAGVDIAPGGDGGPASYVPEFWGLREFDAFLLVVDGVPWGGAFNPALSSLSLTDVDRIEVQRGAAPVMYGATSFVGVIQVLHREAGRARRELTVSGGSYSTGSASLSTALPEWGGISSSLSVDARRQGYRDARTSFERGHVLWRNRRAVGAGRLRFDVDLTWLDQEPASPHIREGMELTSRTPLDSNHNPEGAYLDERRFSISAGYDRSLSGGDWTTTLQLAPSKTRLFRGFLTSLTDDPTTDNARGIREDIDAVDVYFDSHFTRDFERGVRVVVGFDHLHGDGEAEGADFDYFTALSGGRPTRVDVPTRLELGVMDRRELSGLYGYVEWNPIDRLRLEAGLRLNRTDEERERDEGRVETPEEEAANHQDHLRTSGSLGAAFTAWEKGPDRLRLVALYKNTFKPAAFDFGLAEGEGGEGEEEGLLAPETGSSYELGVKGRLANGRVGFEVMSFLMDFENLVLSQSLNGLPSLINGGKQRFEGVDVALDYQLRGDLYGRTTYGWHDARFTDYLTEFDGEPAQLSGHRLEMSPRNLGSTALVYAPSHGVVASAQANFVGSRYLNKRNTALAGDYVTWSAGVGYRAERWELRLDGFNLDDARPPVSESELGDAQYYRLTPRSFEASLRYHF